MNLSSLIPDCQSVLNLIRINLPDLWCAGNDTIEVKCGLTFA